ncbi:F-box domain-containing protein [Mycena venus]|uniref:F-box domain-containing protein n=1 Tax=Mycena venus TaxID=2733690 RepID=A0A8H6X6S4_9AGAR|nr:F-box domain-containing protein [Mycena venus]
MLRALEEDRARVADIEAQIRVLEHSISVLRAQKALVQERLDSYTYPVLTLPNEITSEIFIHFLPTYPLYPPLTGLLSPNLLAQICRTWREIALATPALWSAISLSFYSRHYKQESHISQMWLDRSGCRPLSIKIFTDGIYTPSRPLEVIGPVNSQRARWEYLKLVLSQSFTFILEGPMPTLRQLDFELEYSDPPVDFIACAASRVMLPWSQLTALTLQMVYLRECVPILQQTPNLMYCKLDLVLDPEPDVLPEVRLPLLESLILNDDGEPILGYLDTFVVPALRHLEIPELELGKNPTDTLSSFVSKSGCKLQDLRITGLLSIIRDVREYRRAFPSISKLSLDGWYLLEHEEKEISEVDELA